MPLLAWYPSTSSNCGSSDCPLVLEQQSPNPGPLCTGKAFPSQTAQIFPTCCRCRFASQSTDRDAVGIHVYAQGPAAQPSGTPEHRRQCIECRCQPIRWKMEQSVSLMTEKAFPGHWIWLAGHRLEALVLEQEEIWRRKEWWGRQPLSRSHSSSPLYCSYFLFHSIPLFLFKLGEHIEEDPWKQKGKCRQAEC